VNSHDLQKLVTACVSVAKRAQSNVFPASGDEMLTGNGLLAATIFKEAMRNDELKKALMEKSLT
jgi:hypothetical protein